MWKEYPRSKRMYEEAQEIFAMGVGSQVQSFSRPHPKRVCGIRLPHLRKTASKNLQTVDAAFSKMAES
jgi:hypothetical protein